MKLKNIIGLSVAALAFAACTSEDALVSNKELEQQAIEFVPYTNIAGSRADTVSNGLFLEKGFKVYANVKTAGTQETTPLMNNQQVSWYEETNPVKWTYSPVKYWPTSEDATVDFYAFINTDNHNNSPKANNNVVNTKVTADWYNIPQVHFYVNPTVSNQTDYLWAAPLLDQKREDYTLGDPVKFTFKHATTAYGFTFRLGKRGADGITIADATASDYEEIEMIKINSITMSGFFAPEATIHPRETDINKIWEYEGKYLNRSYTISTDNGSINPNWKYTKLDMDNADPKVVSYDVDGTKVDYMMLLPSSEEMEITIKVNYTIYTKDIEGNMVPQTYDAETTETLKGNAPGNMIMNNIRLTLDKITFDAEVIPWNTASSTIVDIP